MSLQPHGESRTPLGTLEHSPTFLQEEIRQGKDSPIKHSNYSNPLRQPAGTSVQNIKGKLLVGAAIMLSSCGKHVDVSTQSTMIGDCTESSGDSY